MRYAVKAIQKSRVRDYETFQNEIKILRTLVLYCDTLTFCRTTQTSSNSTKSGNGSKSASSSPSKLPTPPTYLYQPLVTAREANFSTSLSSERHSQRRRQP